MRKLFAALILLPTFAFGQTFTYPNAYSIWSPWDGRIKYDGFAALVDISGVEVARVPIASIFAVTLTANFPAQVTSTTVAKLRLGWTQAGTTAGVADLDGAYTTSYKLTPPFVVPAGATTKVAYNTFTGVPVVTVTPPPPPVVLPPPPPAPGISPVGSTAVPGQTLLTAQGAWSFDLVNMGSGGNVLLLNGAAAGGSGIKFAITVDGLKVLNTANQWWLWTGSVWTASTAP